jgi:hypothetical protein
VVRGRPDADRSRWARELRSGPTPLHVWRARERPGRHPGQRWVDPLPARAAKHATAGRRHLHGLLGVQQDPQHVHDQVQQRAALAWIRFGATSLYSSLGIHE